MDLTRPADLAAANGKTVLITGGASGLGEGMVRRFAKAGANVIVADLAGSKGEALVEELRKETENWNHHFIPCDVTSWAQQCALFTRALALSPSKRLHSVIANAGVGEVGDFLKPSPASDRQPPEPDLTTLDVNLKGVIFTTKLALHHFRAKSPGGEEEEDQHLLLIGSMASFADSPGVVSLYAASKHAVLALFRTLRLHPGNENKQVRFNIVCPYFVATPIIPTMGRVMLSGVELARAEDVVEAAARLVCDVRAKGKCLVVAPRGVGGILEMETASMKDVEAFTRRVVGALNAQGHMQTLARWSVDMVRIFGVKVVAVFGAVAAAVAWWWWCMVCKQRV
ncbi:hypothetical protein FN846DRAFT_775692 [Sphaerosporella brunnea]|uniref:NAD(P)-binding protein n=1 Tax=Sphaerosporella brunnea TaxID=1250544 RepID=A0A5J5F2B0_9PEZI|nr:hypothetical protein FN846DRAFT_775692 [Sphaerosporella brunnea]